MSTLYYRLTNAFNGPSLSLDVIGGSTDLTVADTGNFSGQFWKLIPVPNTTNKFHLRTLYKGDGFSLDVINDPEAAQKTPHLAATGNYSGQVWTLTRAGDSDAFKLSNDFTGPDAFLDVFSDQRKLTLSTGNTTGQRWTLTLVRIE